MRTGLRCPYPTFVSGSEEAAPLSEHVGAGYIVGVGVVVLDVAPRPKVVVDRGMDYANFCNVRMRRNRKIARSRRRNGKCEFSARLLNQRPISRSPPRPRSFRATQ